MDKSIRTFGVRDHDEYWCRREQTGDAREGRLHRFLAKLIGELAGPGGKVLDCGVGDGHVFRLCCQSQQMYGVELSRHAIDGYDFPTENIRQADLNAGIPDFGVQFDVILASMIVHWLDDPPRFLDEVARHLRPGGWFVPVVPNITYYRHRIAYLFGKFPGISLSHKNFQTPAEFGRMVLDGGWTIVRRTTPKKSIRARLWPTVFSQDVVYVCTV